MSHALIMDGNMVVGRTMEAADGVRFDFLDRTGTEQHALEAAVGADLT